MKFSEALEAIDVALDAPVGTARDHIAGQIRARGFLDRNPEPDDERWRIIKTTWNSVTLIRDVTLSGGRALRGSRIIVSRRPCRALDKDAAINDGVSLKGDVDPDLLKKYMRDSFRLCVQY